MRGEIGLQVEIVEHLHLPIAVVALELIDILTRAGTCRRRPCVIHIANLLLQTNTGQRLAEKTRAAHTHVYVWTGRAAS